MRPPEYTTMSRRKPKRKQQGSRSKPQPITVALPVLPAMRCDDNCGECCGPLPVGRAEWKRIADHLVTSGVQPQNNGPDTCPFYQGGRCAIYAVRPFMCRAFGHPPELTCPRGYNANADHGQMEAALFAQIANTQPPIRWLHEFLNDPALLAEMLERTRAGHERIAKRKALAEELVQNQPKLFEGIVLTVHP